jgi:hypothetical protein
VRRESPLRGNGGRKSRPGTRKSCEELVSSAVDLGATVLRNSRAQDSPMILERAAVPVAEAPE